MRLTRLAPSPTGALHLGNARTFLVTWLLARQNGWRILLRIEDLDGPRIKKGADAQAIEDLHWLGLDWDEGPIHQSDRREVYAKTVKQLVDSGRAYPCVCTRKDVDAAASAPHAEDGAAVYPGICRNQYASIDAARTRTGREPAIRFNVGDSALSFDDSFAGHQHYEVARQLGDFVIAKADESPSYQLAVVVDDASAGVTDVIRGNDLLDSTPRQILLYRALGMHDRIPVYTHLPLVVGTDGRRLAKRHGDTRLSFYRDQGTPAGRVRALLARWSGVACGIDISMNELIERFRLENVPAAPVVFTSRDDAWLRGSNP